MLNFFLKLVKNDYFQGMSNNRFKDYQINILAWDHAWDSISISFGK